MSQTHTVTHSLTRRLAISAISPLFVVRLGRSLRFCHLEFDINPFMIVVGATTPVSVEGFEF